MYRAYMLDQDQTAEICMNNLIHRVTDGYLMRANCFTSGGNASGYTNFFLQRRTAPAIVLVREQGYETLRGVVLPITSEESGAPYRFDKGDALIYLRTGKLIAEHKDMLLIPRPYLEAKGMVDDLHFIIDSKLHFGQTIITKPNVADYAHHIFYEETGKDLKQALFPNYKPKESFGNAAGAKFEDQISFGNYQIDVVAMPS